jgi:regulator of protease activity HflC (stomatin/prohibitin superfamily)
MWFLKRILVHSYELGLCFRNGEFKGLLSPGRYWFFDPLGKLRIELVSQRDPWLVHDKLDLIVKAEVLTGRAEVVDLKDYQRALVWIDGRFSHVLPPGLYAYWTGLRKVEIEIVDARTVRLEHRLLPIIVRSPMADRVLESCVVEQGRVGVVFRDGEYTETLPPGQYAFWKNVAAIKVMPVDLREQILDLAGQDIMTADKVTLRLNAVITYRVVDARKSVCAVEDARQALYRDAQLALRAVVGTRELDAFLNDKDAVARDMEALVRRRVGEFGLEVLAVGVRDIILPGEMKELLNRVTEARKAAEANLITRREETAAMRSQANTAKLLEGNPTLMRLRELEVLEKVAASAKLNVVLGDKGLANQVVNVL